MASRTVPRRGVPPPGRRRAGVVRGQPGPPAAPGETARAVPARVRLPRSAEPQAPVHSPGRRSRPRRDRTGPPGEGHLLADRRLLAVRRVRGGRLHPRRRQPGGRPTALGMSGTRPAPWSSAAITPILSARSSLA